MPIFIQENWQFIAFMGGIIGTFSAMKMTMRNLEKATEHLAERVDEIKDAQGITEIAQAVCEVRSKNIAEQLSDMQKKLDRLLERQ